MNNIWKYFKAEIILAPIVIAFMTFFYGIQGGLVATTVLAILEISVSFDNAVVNAALLEPMTQKERNWFLTWGMVIAVGFMRLLFPVIIVCITAMINPWEALKLAFTAPAQYAAHVQAAHIVISGFGGAFLMMLFAQQFIDAEKDEHWIPGVEHILAKIGNAKFAPTIFTVVLLVLASIIVEQAHQVEFLIAGAVGIVANLAVGALKSVMEGKLEAGAAGVTAGVAASAGIAGLVHLEVVDASFSFDGVIGAFALSNQFIVIAAGLGIGALAVRSLTMWLVDGKALATLRYLEHGAFWAIGVLSAIMLVSPSYEVPEWFTGIIGAVIIGIAVIHSLRANKADAANEVVAEVAQ